MLALLGIAHRQIKAKRTPDTGMVQHRMAIPKEVKSLGDQLRKSRMSAWLTQRQVVANLRIPRLRLQQFERDETMPSAGEWEKLAGVLSLSHSDILNQPNGGL